MGYMLRTLCDTLRMTHMTHMTRMTHTTHTTRCPCALLPDTP